MHTRCTYSAAASVIRAQLPFPPAEINSVLAQLGPVGESDNGIELFDFFAVKAELHKRHGIKAADVAISYMTKTNDDDDECVFYREDEDDE
jgi:hypothetical protein